jgi:outer membrane lipopolysaccharide assembly protein LptE/RlpB
MGKTLMKIIALAGILLFLAACGDQVRQSYTLMWQDFASANGDLKPG